MHPPVAVEASLAYSVIRARVGAHPDTASLASLMPELLDHAIEALPDLAAQSFDAWVASPCHGDAEPWRHQPSRTTRSEIHDVAGQSVLQPLSRSRLRQSSLVSGLLQQLRETALILGKSTQLAQALLELLHAREPNALR